MALIKVQPQLEVLAYPRETSERYTRKPFSIADDFAQVFTDWGDTSGSREELPNANILNQPMLTGVGSPKFGKNLEFVTFAKDGTVTEGAKGGNSEDGVEVTGLVVRPICIPFDSIVENDTRGAPMADSGEILRWKVEGTIETIKPLEDKLKTYICCTDAESFSMAYCNGFEVGHEVIGGLPIPVRAPEFFRDQGFQFDIFLRGFAGDIDGDGGEEGEEGEGDEEGGNNEGGEGGNKNPALVLSFAPDWFVVYEKGSHPRICRANDFLSDNFDEEEEDGGSKKAKKGKDKRKMINHRTYRAAPKSEFKGDRIKLQVYLVNGYLIIQQATNGVEAAPIYIREYDPNTNGNQNARAINITYQPSLMVSSFGCKFSLGTSLIMHRRKNEIQWSDAGFPPIRGVVENTVSRQVRINSGVAGLTSETTDGYILGWTDGGTGCPCTITLPNEGNPKPRLGYNCELVPSFNGVHTPFIKKVLYRNPGTLVKMDNTPIDITPAIRTCKESIGEIPSTNGAEWTFEINRNILDEITRDVNGASISHWTQFVKPYSPISSKVRWMYSDDTFGYPQYSYGDWSGRFMGYMMGMTKSNPRFAEWMLNLTCYDPYIRLVSPHNMLDYRYYDFNILYASKHGQSLYGSEVVKEILRIALGNEWANSLQVYYEEGHYPLLAGLDAGSNEIVPGISGQGRPMQNTDFLIPPYGESDPLEFIHRFCDADYAIFGFGKPQGSGFERDGIEWPAPFYGQYYKVMENSPVHNVYDAIYDETDINNILHSAEATFLHERDYNHFLILGEVQGQNARLPWSEPIMGESRLPATDPKNEEDTWRRTYFKKSAAFQYPGWAQRYADLMMLMFREVTMERVNLTFRGEENLWWGHKIWPRMTAQDCDYSDPTMNINRHGTEGSPPPENPFVVTRTDGEYQPSGSRPYRVISIDNSYNMEKNDASAFQTTAQCFPINSVEK